MFGVFAAVTAASVANRESRDLAPLALSTYPLQGPSEVPVPRVPREQVEVPGSEVPGSACAAGAIFFDFFATMGPLRWFTTGSRRKWNNDLIKKVSV